MSVSKANTTCWMTGIYTDECDCYQCDYQGECSGSDIYDDEDDD